MSDTIMTVDTDHGVYDARPWQPPDCGPANALVTVFCEDGCLTGWVTGAFGTCTAHAGDFDHADGRAHRIGITASLEGAVTMLAARDEGLKS